MYFLETCFHNFRNLCGGRREWSPGVNIIIGPNGSGKTNFLEGLNLMSGWGPFEKSAKMSDMIRWDAGDCTAENAGAASVWGKASGEETMELSASIRARCQLRRDGKASPASCVRRGVPLLSFTPGNMSILTGGASHRRRLLDMAGVLMSFSYAQVLRDYRLILRQKAALLRRRMDARNADRVLIQLGSWLWRAREEIVGMISAASADFSDLMPRPMDFFFSRGGGGMDDDPADDFKKSLAREAERERASCVPLVGPQRDDVRLTCGGRDASAVLSRGQGRRAVSAVILASALAVERRLMKRPVLLFDEMTSELDEDGRGREIGSLAAAGCQVFAATADAPVYSGVEIHKIQDGRFL